MSSTPPQSGHARRPRVLCVDDEPAVLDSLRRQLHREFEIQGVESGLEALAILAADPSFPVLISDMRMPGMDGVAVLAEARSLQPETVRILLTGQADMETAAAAVNNGNIFRFLVKPCPAPVMAKALTDAVEQYRLITAERELLERTLRGSVAALFEILSLANPMAFARAARIHRIVLQLIEIISPENAWCIEVAAMMSQIGAVVLAPETLEKLNAGSPLSPQEQLQVRVLPWHAERLLGQIPRLELVRKIIHDQTIPFDNTHAPDREGGDDPIGPAIAARGAQMLRTAIDLESLEARGLHRSIALNILRRSLVAYDPRLLDALQERAEAPGDQSGSLKLMLDELRPGSTIASDVTDSAGRILAGRGNEVIENLIERIHN